MLYNGPIAYNEPAISYSGTLIINAPSLLSPIILNNISILFGGSEDYSNYTTIAFITMDVSSTGVVSIEVLDEDLSALVSVESIAITDDSEIAIIY